MEYTRLVIDETPYAIWGSDIHADNLRCINSIDPQYFHYLAQAHTAGLEIDDKQYAAVALRASYSQALETMFALLGATIQAPWCIPAWLCKYRNNELESLVTKIQEQRQVYTWLKVNPVSWKTLAEVIFSHFDGDNKAQVQEAFARLWSTLAAEFLDQDASEEYNSIKHGLRAGMHGFSFAAGIQDQPGVPSENLKSLGGSEFGLNYFSVKPVGNAKYNFQLVDKAYNWHPAKFQTALGLIALSIQNVLAFLRFVNGVPAPEVKYLWPEDLNVFKEPWAKRVGVHKLSWSEVLPAGIEPRTKEDILATYSENHDGIPGDTTPGG